MASRDTRCPERSGLGPSLGRGQSRPGMSSIGCSTPDLEELRRLPRSEGNFRPVHGSRPARGFRGSGCSSGPQSCSWRHPPAEIVRARVASSLPRKRPGRGLVGVLYIDESTRQVRRPASRGNARRRALERAPRAVSHDRRHLDTRNAAVIDVPAADRDQATEWRKTACRIPRSAAEKEVSEVTIDRAAGEPKRRRSSLQGA
jgi:hypothetical protein